MPETPLRLIVGLGNPGAEYEKTRHNVGAVFVETVLQQIGAQITLEKKFKGKHYRYKTASLDCHFLIPTTYMNHSGQAVKAIASFYKIPAEEILIIHDELDLPTGVVRLKVGGGHGGHNGLRDITSHLNTNKFLRLRIGIDHPPMQDVIHYVLQKPTASEHAHIAEACETVHHLLPDLLAGKTDAVMKALHTKREVPHGI